MLSSNVDRVAIDTNVLTGALVGRAGHNRRVIQACLGGRLQPLVEQAMFLAYEDVLSRRDLYRSCPLSRKERRELFAAFLSVCEWVETYLMWPPDLADEADSHIVELAVAGGARMVVTNNVGDLRAAAVRFPGLRTVTPQELLKEFQ